MKAYLDASISSCWLSIWILNIFIWYPFPCVGIGLRLNSRYFRWVLIMEGIPRCFNIKLLIINMDIEHIHLVPVSLCRYWSTSEFHIFPLGSNNGIAHSNLVSMPSLFQTLCFTISMFSLLEQGFKLSYCHPHSSSAM